MSAAFFNLPAEQQVEVISNSPNAFVGDEIDKALDVYDGGDIVFDALDMLKKGNFHNDQEVISYLQSRGVLDGDEALTPFGKKFQASL